MLPRPAPSCFPIRRSLLPAIGILLFLSLSSWGRSASAPVQKSEGGASPEQLLLKDYRPQSIFKVPQTRVQQARFPVDYTGFDQPGFGPAAVAELERCVQAGAVGVGELSDKGGGLRGNSGGLHIDDPRMDPILEKCADLGLPVNIHVGEDRWTEDEHFYARHLFSYHWPLHGFGLTDAVLKQVYGDNARRILTRKSEARSTRPHEP